jgi:hypothetical protein
VDAESFCVVSLLQQLKARRSDGTAKNYAPEIVRDFLELPGVFIRNPDFGLAKYGVFGK